MTQEFIVELAPLQERCAKAIFDQANSRYSRDGWNRVYFDFRFVGLTNEGVAGGGVILANGEKRRDFDAPIDVYTILFNEIAPLRRSFQEQAFFGIVFVIENSGKVEILYDNDPNCIKRGVQDRRAGKPF